MLEFFVLILILSVFVVDFYEEFGLGEFLWVVGVELFVEVVFGVFDFGWVVEVFWGGFM